MGKGKILSSLGEGQYQVQLLRNREKADKALAEIEKWIALNLERTSKIPIGDPDKKLPALKLSLASLKKQKEYLLVIPEDITTTAWAVDYDYLSPMSGIVGTIEINGDESKVFIQPAFQDVTRFGSHYDEIKDGQLMHISAMIPEQAMYSLAMSPGWKKWMPTYRTGTITGKTKSLCNVALDEAMTPIANSDETRSINVNDILMNVPIRYLDLDGCIFSVGDKVVVKFGGQSPVHPEVIGFQDNPRGKDTAVVAFMAYKEGDEYRIGAYDMEGTRIAAYDLHRAVGTNPEFKLVVIGCCEDVNCIYVTGLGKVWTKSPFDDTWDWAQTPTLYRIPVSWNYENQFIWATGSCPMVWWGPYFGYNHCDIRMSVSVGGYVIICYGNDDETVYADPQTGPGTHIYGFPSSMPTMCNNLNVITKIMEEDKEHFYDGTWHPPDGVWNPDENYPHDWLNRYKSFRAVCFSGNRLYFLWEEGYTDDPAVLSAYHSFAATTNRLSRWNFPLFPDPPAYDSPWTPDPANWMHPYFMFAEPQWGQFEDPHDYETLSYDCTHSATFMLSFQGNKYVFYGGFCIVNPNGQQLFPSGEHVVYLPYPCVAVAGAFVRVGGYYYLAVKDKSTSNIYFFDTGVLTSYAYGFDTRFRWDLKVVVTLQDIDPFPTAPNPYGPLATIVNFAIINVPITNMVLDFVNELRREHTRTAVAYSRELSKVAQAHADWCAANGVSSHTGVEILNEETYVWEKSDPQARGKVYGFMMATEVLASLRGGPRQYDDLAICFEGWRGSPGHLETLIQADHVMMGYGVATYPAKFTKITHGAGNYNEETHSYSTEDSEQVFSSKDIGNTKTYVVMLCPC